MRYAFLVFILVGLPLFLAPAASLQSQTRPDEALGDLSRYDKLDEGRYLSVAEIKAKQEWEREHAIRFAKLVRGNPRLKQVALTFDDGPHAGFTPRLVELLRTLRVRATFFVVGMMVDRHPELVTMEEAAGHEVANHTYHHRRLPTLTDAGIEKELRMGAQAIRRAIGAPTRLYRPAGGEYDPDVVNVTRRLGYCMVLWTDDPSDFRHPGAQRIVNRTMRKVANGGIVLLHDGVQETLDVLPGIVAGLRRRGFSFVTCSQMATERGIVTDGGPNTYRGKP